ncbi:ethanolamine ammonia-lyase subunit EutC [Salinisphaera sp. T31B1]|uniref:ethanolamine ammonia-lyase subunit EutC n=1 Tax=Salinisphaera sp. T31B1 TaxID=727963 RepID=UPI003342C9AB
MVDDDHGAPGSEIEPANRNDRGDGGGVIANPWRGLRAFTDARIGLGRAGISLPTRRLLEFQLAHAQAKDAVHLPLDVDALCEALDEAALAGVDDAPIRLHSRAEDRTAYLQRPDHGRRLDEASCERLASHTGQAETRRDLALVVVDGLSSLGVQNNAVPFLRVFCEALAADTNHDWHLAPLAVVEQGRVAIGDEIGSLLNADAVIVLIGERPGLSSPDSLGLYMTWNPTIGTTDAYRNCISNIRPAGLSADQASERALYLLSEARTRDLSGVELKDRSDEDVIEHDEGTGNFLIS